MNPIVETASGAIQGEIADGVHCFLGIPYAAPPVGEARWRPPAPPAAWDGVRPATSFGASAMQAARPDIVLRSGLSEDCLYLNVWTPELSEGARHPVMVWIHGGGFMFGAGSEPVHDGRTLARAGAVVVTFNYRLHAFGFLAHPEIGGNFGLQDQLAALRWVRENASRFGGDPDNITLFGESAGAASVAHLMRAARADALFGRAVLQSGGFEPPPASTRRFDLDQAEGIARAFLDALGCADFAAARRVEAARILAVGDRLLMESVGPSRFVTPEDLLFQPVIDERIAPFDRGFSAVADRPVLLGYNDNEATYFARPDVPFAEQDLLALLGGVASDQAGAIAGELRAAGLGSAGTALERAMTVAVFVEPTFDMAERLVAGGAPVFLYRFARVSPKGRATGMLASHSFEIPYVFGLPPDDPGYEAADRRLADAMRRAWTAFATTGRPACEGVQWPAFRPDEPRVALLDDGVADRPFEPPALFASFRRIRQSLRRPR